jgi:hypothetical protein
MEDENYLGRSFWAKSLKMFGFMQPKQCETFNPVVTIFEIPDPEIH